MIQTLLMLFLLFQLQPREKTNGRCTHECHCIRDSKAEREKLEKECYTTKKTEKELYLCLSSIHCRVVKDSDKRWNGVCKPVCLKHRCTCNDREICEVGEGGEEEQP